MVHVMSYHIISIHLTQPHLALHHTPSQTCDPYAMRALGRPSGGAGQQGHGLGLGRGRRVAARAAAAGSATPAQSPSLLSAPPVLKWAVGTVIGPLVLKVVAALTVLLGLQLIQSVLIGGTSALDDAPANARALLLAVWSLLRSVLWSVSEGVKSAVESAGMESAAGPTGETWD